MNSIKQTLSFPAFRSRNYRLFFLGQGLSLVGSWITMVAMVWLVYHLTQSPVLLGIVGFVSQVPNLVLVPFGGVLSDMSFLGMISFGNLFQGTLVSLLGAPTTVAVSGVICVLVSIFYARQLPRLRRMVWASHPELAPPNLQP